MTAEHSTGSKHGGASSSIQFDVWLPLQCYELKIRHKLLAQLGRISHFVILCQSRSDTNPAELSAITSLGRAQLKPVLERLRGLRILDDSGLTRSGRQYAHILATLHEQKARLWMDTQHDQAPVLLHGNHPSVTTIPPDELVAEGRRQQDGRVSRGRRFELERQLARMRHYDFQCAWLPFLFPSFAELAQQPDEGWWRDWEMELTHCSDAFTEHASDAACDPVDGMHGLDAGLCGVELTLSTGAEAQCSQPALELDNAVMELRTQYALPEGLPTTLAPIVPDEGVLYYDFLDESVLHAQPPAGDGTGYTLVFPDETLHEDVAVRALFAAQRPPASKELDMLNRMHVFTPRWRRRAFPWTAVYSALATLGNVWIPQNHENS
ncbi:hypothetical protein [Burkholderia contaminans]|uniref:hypothetical protein n=1 Tax=Burkholderia contaminans TaxID=488447 RepID=UPI000F559CCF|nr:hypothetical protein [Burkholderia contaminans]RQT38579.1 hypothetical protein DF036_07985 [Burkholderia contaminans]